MSRIASKLSQLIVQILDDKRPLCVFESPLGSLGATYTVHRRLIGWRRGLPNRGNRMFLVTVLRLRGYERILIKNQRFFQMGCGFLPNFLVKGMSPTNHFWWDWQPKEYLTTSPLTACTEINFVAEFRRESGFREKRPFCILSPPPRVPFRLIGKRVVDFLTVLIELFR